MPELSGTSIAVSVYIKEILGYFENVPRLESHNLKTAQKRAETQESSLTNAGKTVKRFEGYWPMQNQLESTLKPSQHLIIALEPTRCVDSLDLKP